MKHILVVDDVPEIRFVYTELFRQNDVTVLEAGDGCEALEILDTSQVDLVLTDCQMPHMTGIELMRVAQERFPELPFIVVSSTAREEDMTGLTPYAVMPKPFKLSELKAAVGTVLGGL
jgi:CheY-like chemotaxis protein